MPAAGGGAGGTGTGGNGSGGTGEGSDGSGGGGTPPVQIGGRITDRDYPRALSDIGISGTVSVRYRVGVDGRVTDCLITHSSGHEELDVLTCRLIERRFRYRPSRDEEGRPVPSTIVENHSWIIPPPTIEEGQEQSDKSPYLQR
jgi:protein TonB